jgi:glycosyltransferase involved in cell wall biosynthesis
MHCDWLVELPRPTVARRLASLDLVLGVSSEVVRRIRDAFPDLAPRCEWLPTGVDLGAFPPRERVAVERAGALAALRARHGLRGPVLLYVGRLSSEKGVHVLLEALGALRVRHPDLACLVVGPDWGPIRRVAGLGPDQVARQLRVLDRSSMSHLRWLAAPHGDRVVFTGPIPNRELSLYHAAADVLVAPSLVESFGIPAIEAAASGLPVVAATTGGLLDTVLPDRTGLLVPAGDATAVAEAVERLLADPSRARALGRAARERVAARFTWDRVTDTRAGYYERLLSTPATGRAAWQRDPRSVPWVERRRGCLASDL